MNVDWFGVGLARVSHGDGHALHTTHVFHLPTSISILGRLDDRARPSVGVGLWLRRNKEKKNKGSVEGCRSLCKWKRPWIESAHRWRKNWNQRISGLLLPRVDHLGGRRRPSSRPARSIEEDDGAWQDMQHAQHIIVAYVFTYPSFHTNAISSEPSSPSIRCQCVQVGHVHHFHTATRPTRRLTLPKSDPTLSQPLDLTHGKYG